MAARLHRHIDQTTRFTLMQPLEGKEIFLIFDHFKFLFFKTIQRSGLSRSTKSLRMPWYQKPLVKNNQYMNIQKGAIIMSVVGIVRSNRQRFTYQFGDKMFSLIPVCLLVHDSYGSFRSLLLLDGGTRINALRLLHHLVRVCLRWQHARPQCIGDFCPLLCSGRMCNLHYEHHACRGSSQGKLNIQLNTKHSSRSLLQSNSSSL